MEAISGVTTMVEGKLGLSTTAAQVLAWLIILTIMWMAFTMIAPKRGVLGKRKRGDTVLLLGQCGSGKTALFFKLRDDDGAVQTVSSLKPLRDSFAIKALEGSPTLDFVDCPGHPRMRGRGAELLKEAKCIVYLVDSEDKPKLKDAAEHLYELLTHPDLLQLHTPILLALNKTDLSTARTEKFILDELDREIEIMRNSRGAALEGQDAADSYLGIEGEKFKLLQHAPCPVQTCRISVKKPALDPLYDFLRDQFAF
mmetsp:Transcript_5758/g.16276  ORF Transcript_5758/g.16276 Transcript_5758/m.16276 type:complete len:255 (-) Transcript_5758:52-816(-)